MNELLSYFSTNKNMLTYETLKKDITLAKTVYENINVTHEQTPFDYIDTISIDEKEIVYLGAFIEPVGLLYFKGPLVSFFTDLNHLLNTQPITMSYIEAGHCLYEYVKHVRKGRAIDVRYVAPHELWSYESEVEQIKNDIDPIPFHAIQTGQDLFHYVNQQNRVPFVILDEILFGAEGVASLMMGEMLTAEAYLPDLFKIIIDLRKYEAHNRSVVKYYTNMNEFELNYPKNHIIQYYLGYDDVLKNQEAFQLIEEKDEFEIRQEALRYYTSGFDGEYVEWKVHKNEK